MNHHLILNQIDQEIQNNQYKPNPHEIKCITAYKYTPFFHGLNVFTLFGVSYWTMIH